MLATFLRLTSAYGETLERLRRLQSVTEAALAHLSLDQLLDELLDRVREALAADTCAVLLRDEDTNELVARAARGIEEEVERGVRVPIGQGFAGRIAAEQRPVVIDDVDHADVLNPLLREKGIKSLAGVPLIVHGNVLGVLHVGSLTPREFTSEEVEFLQLAADRVALGIDHGRLFETERATAARLAKLQSVTDAALAHLSVDDLLDELLDRVRDALAADTCAILLLDDVRNELVARAARGIEEEVEQGVRIPLGAGFAGRVAAERRAIVIPDVDQADIYNPILREKGIKSLLGAPLLARDRVLGVIHVGTLTPRDFTTQDMELLQLAAERAAMGIEKALLHQELMRFDQVRHAFVAIASHELRTPSAAVVGAAATLYERAGQLTPEQEAQLKQMLAEQSQRLATLIEQLLDLSRLEQRAVEIRPVRLNLRGHVEQIVERVSERPEAVAIEVPPDLEAEADPVALERVVTNLVVNAIRHGEPPVLVSAERRDRHVRVTVEDHGAGVAPDVVDRLFDPFARSAAAARGGSGLGLAIAKSYANAHGGDVVYDAALSGGARFHLVLPVEQPA